MAASWHRGVLTSATWLTPTVRRLRLRVEPADAAAPRAAPPGATGTAPLSFIPGQWVDVSFPGTAALGGYSLTSSPLELPEVELAVRLSSHPAARAACSQGEGSEWQLRVGPPRLALRPDFAGSCNLFVAGGIGVTPLYGMVRHMALSYERGQDDARFPLTTLMLSARTEEELVFEDQLMLLESCLDGRFEYRPHVTGTGSTGTSAAAAAAEVVAAERRSRRELQREVQHGRIDRAALLRALARFPQPPQCYLCGPKGFSEALGKELVGLGVPARNLLYESWW
jgi:ferredoxin-NADP reductase